MKESFAETSTGLLFLTDGLSGMVKWDGLSTQLASVGVPAPASAPVVSGSGTGAIVGTYYAYLRFLDKDGNLSDLSPIAAAYVATGGSGAVAGATNATPVVITSAGHGLVTGDRVKLVGVGGNDVNDTWDVTVLSADAFSLDGSVGNGDYTGGGTWTAGVDTITYSSVQLPTLPKVQRRQILRNTDGQADTFYVDVDTTDLTATTFNSTRTDSELSAQTSQAILDSGGLPLANRNGLPPAHKAFLAQHQDRMFAAGETVYRCGSAKVTLGSATVTGVGTGWLTTFADRFLHVTGATRSYQIASVDAAAQTLTLTEPYRGATDPFALYAIRAAPAERRLLYFTESGKPESWPAINAMSIQEDGDEITGLMVRGAWLYVLERRHAYRVTFGSDPLRDGGVFPASTRGCVNNRCWVVVGDVAYMLDEQGLHRFDETQDDQSVSGAVQELFRPSGVAAHRINWAAQDQFHAVHYQPQETIRWFVCLDGACRPQHALAYNYGMQRAWIDKFPYPVTAACAGTRGGMPQVYLGCTARRVMSFWHGTLDGPDPAGGTTRGTATSAGAASLADTAATFAAAGVVSAPLVIVSGKGKGQSRIVTAVSGTTLEVDQPWLVQPDATSVYQLGGVPWLWRSGWYRYAASDKMQSRGLEIIFKQLASAATMDVRIYEDYSRTAKVWRNAMTSAGGRGLAVTTASADFVVDLETDKGIVRKQLPGHKENWFVGGKQAMQLEMSGVSGEEQQAVYGVAYLGAVGG